ncbi:hypothetical protein CWS02_04290 [Enterobacter sp. EA-1]|nr:hypothetical protein CWS02_04290 [Enterobacter sp. EA-1]
MAGNARGKRMNLTLDDNANDINYKEILDHLECPIYVTDANGVTRYVNLAYLAENPIVDRDKLIGRSVGDIIRREIFQPEAITMRVLHEQREAIGSIESSSSARQKRLCLWPPNL